MIGEDGEADGKRGWDTRGHESLQSGVWGLEAGIWSLEAGVWSLEFGVAGVWSMES